MKDTFSKRENSLKYDNRATGDLITQWELINALTGIIGCLTAAQKYPKRYHSQSKKANNPADVEKCKDYLQRAKDIAAQFEETESFAESINTQVFDADIIKDYLLQISAFLPKFTYKLPF